MANWNIVVDPPNDQVGVRALVTTSAGTALVSAYRASIGGSLYKELKNRVDGVLTGNSTTQFPAGFALGKLGGGALPSVAAVGVDDLVDLDILDPAANLGTVNAIRTEAMP